MAKENKKEISFVEGPIFQSLIRFALPVLGALILQAAYGAVDLLVVGWFGDASSISAVGTGSNFMQMVTFIITSLAMGSTVMIGQHIGEGKPDKAGKTVGTSIVLFAIIGVVMTVILELFAGPIANILQVPAESFDKTVLYLRICSGGILIIIAYNVISSVLRGIGNANLPLLFVGIACAAFARLAHADAVFVLGIQSTRGIANAFFSHLEYLRPRVSYSEGASGSWVESLNSGFSHPYVVLTDTRTYSAMARQYCRVASEKGIPLALITDIWCPWARDYPMDLLQVKTDTGHFWDSLAPVSCLFNLLLSGVVEALGDALPARLAVNRQLQQEFGQFER